MSVLLSFDVILVFFSLFFRIFRLFLFNALQLFGAMLPLPCYSRLFRRKKRETRKLRPIIIIITTCAFFRRFRDEAKALYFSFLSLFPSLSPCVYVCSWPLSHVSTGYVSLSTLSSLRIKVQNDRNRYLSHSIVANTFSHKYRESHKAAVASFGLFFRDFIHAYFSRHTK